MNPAPPRPSVSEDPSSVVASNPEFPLGSRGSEDAAAVIWPRGSDPAGAHASRAAALRRKGVTRALIGLVAAGLFFAFGRAVVGAIVASIGAMLLGTALLSPLGAFAAIDRGVARLARAVGLVVSWLVLMPVFVGFFVPFGLLFKRGAGDPMKRAFDPAAPTYFRVRSADTDRVGGATSLY